MQYVKGELKISFVELMGFSFFIISGFLFLFYRCICYRDALRDSFHYQRDFDQVVLTPFEISKKEVLSLAEEYARKKNRDSDLSLKLHNKIHLHGYLGLQNKFHLERLIKELKPKSIVDIGTYYGLSSIFMALKTGEEVKIYTVDPWNAEEYFDGKKGLVSSSKTESIFLANREYYQLTDRILSFKMGSLQAAKELDVNPQLVYIDGDHTTEAVADDILAWYPKLAPGGVLSGDDYNWTSVKKGVDEGLKQLRQRGLIKQEAALHVDESFWWLDPKD